VFARAQHGHVAKHESRRQRDLEVRGEGRVGDERAEVSAHLDPELDVDRVRRIDRGAD
jgi:hypothetical protein